MSIIIEKLDINDQEHIQRISEWYYEEWETPIEKTISRLKGLTENTVPFQLVATKNNQVVGTVGLCHDVNLIKEHKQFNHLGPWVALLLVNKQNRGEGIGRKLMDTLELEAVRLGLDTIYLATFTAESLYKKAAWKEFDRVNYKNHDTVVMKKHLTLIKTQT